MIQNKQLTNIDIKNAVFEQISLKSNWNDV